MIRKLCRHLDEIPTPPAVGKEKMLRSMQPSFPERAGKLLRANQRASCIAPELWEAATEP